MLLLLTCTPNHWSGAEQCGHYSSWGVSIQQCSSRPLTCGAFSITGATSAGSGSS